MRILLLGGGGREHAIARSLSLSERCDKLYVAPGNAGTAFFAQNIAIGINDFPVIRDFVLANEIGLVVVGPEEPLVKGIVDFFRGDDSLKDALIVGPSQHGAQLEGSKDFAKAFMSRHAVPTAGYRTFTADDIADAYDFLETLQPPYVLKADGLAAGKGVVIPETLQEAKAELREMLGGKFGAAGSRVVIEEFLRGIECSVFVATDGESYKILPTAKDYKRVGEGDTGLNTGGMGAVSPVPFADSEFMRKVEDRIVKPTVDGLAKENIDYRGFIFIGLMNVGGEPIVIEYNVRMGDPETEVVFPRITSDAVELMVRIADGTLPGYELRVDPRTAVTVVAVSGGYPGEYAKGFPITGLLPEGAPVRAGNLTSALADGLASKPESTDRETIVFHAGTAVRDDTISFDARHVLSPSSRASRNGDEGSVVVTSGGRVLAVTSLGENIPDALADSYVALKSINFEGIYFRRDIGQDLITL